MSDFIKPRTKITKTNVQKQNSHQGLCPKFASITEISMYNNFTLGLNSMISNLCVFASGSGTGFSRFVHVWMLTIAGMLL